MKLSILKLLALVAMAACAMHADVLGITSDGTLYNGGVFTLGYEFVPTTNISVTSLDVFDDYETGLPSAATIGLWDTSGNLLAWATVDPGTIANDGVFADASITPYSLLAGTDYVVGAYLNGDASSYNTNQGGSGSVDPNITIIQDMYVSAGSLVYPGSSELVPGAWLGGSFSYSQSSAPEPAAFLLGATGLAALLARRLRRA